MNEQRIYDMLAKAEEVFNIEFGDVQINWKEKGLAAGWAKRIKGVYTLDFSIEACKLHPDHFFNDTVPHEVAHLVTYANGVYGSHGPKWKSICIQLGGTGKRCHDLKLTPARRTRKWKYRDSLGGYQVISTVRHNKLQKAKAQGYKWKSGAEISKRDFVGEVK